MATKAALITAINGFITSIVNITKHRNSMLQLVNEFFTTTIFDTQATTNVFTRLTGQTAFNYSFKVKKRGNIVFIQGNITNSTSATQILISLCEITNTEFIPAGAQTILAINNTSTTGLISFLQNPNYIVGNGMQVLAGQIVTINGYYFTND